MKSGVPQGSVPGSLLFNLTTNDFINVTENSQVCTFADDNNMIKWCANSLENILRSLKRGMNIALKFLKGNRMVANADKFQVIFMGPEEGQKIESVLK